MRFNLHIPFYSQKIRQRHERIRALFISTFLISVSQILTIYVLSTYVSSYVGEKNIGWIFVLINIILLLLINIMPNLLAKNGVLPTAVVFILANGTSYLLLAFGVLPSVIVFGFILHIILSALIWVTFDILLERNTKNSLTGSTRGLYYTVSSLGSIITPAFSGLVYDRFGINALFIIAAVLLIPAVIILIKHFQWHEPKLITHKFHFTSVLRKVLADHGLRGVFILSALVNFFYAVMVIYVPIYLRTVVGLSWTELGLIFTVMLIPFALLSYPAGRYADRKKNVTMVLVPGLIILAIFTAIISFVSGNNIFLWMAVLFMTRVGTALADQGIETYFFKRVSALDIDVINFFRNAPVIANLVGPALISLFLLFIPLKFIFIVVGLIILSGLSLALSLEKS